MGIWRLVMETNRLSRPSGCPPGVSQPFHILGRSALIGVSRQNPVKTPQYHMHGVGWCSTFGSLMAIPGPTVADCTHMVGPIMFGWGAKYLRRFSGVSHAFLPSFDDTTLLKQNAPISETAEERLGDTPTGATTCLFLSQDAKCPS